MGIQLTRVLPAALILAVILLVGLQPATAADCDANGLPDECDLACGPAGGPCDLPGCGAATDCDTDGVLDSCEIAGPAHCTFPARMASNTTAAANSVFLGPPDDSYYGLGGKVVTYTLECVVENGAGPDFTVYEVDSGGAEFNLIDVLVSDDGVRFVSVKASEAAAVRIPGDEANTDLSFARSYDLGTLAKAYMIRIDGSGEGASGTSTGFDLDGIGLIHVRNDCNADGVPDLCQLAAGTTPDCNANGLPDGCEPDCNANGVADACNLRDLTSRDCNANGFPDECDINPADPDHNGQVSVDCNTDGVPDECPACPPVELVFVMDTSTSMEDEAAAICANITQVAGKLAADGIQVQATLLGISANPGGIFSCLTGNVMTLYGTTVPGSPPANNTQLGACPGGNEVASEDWGRAVSVAAGRRAWSAGSLRVLVPISDEGPWCGDPVSNPGVDRDSIVHAISVALQDQVVVSPITGSGSSGATIEMAQLLAEGTGGTHFASSNPDGLAAGIEAIVRQACSQASDCNRNGVPDQCDIDPTDPDGNTMVSPDCNANDTPDECEPDCNGNGIPDGCDIAQGTVSDCDGDGQPDLCSLSGTTLVGDRDDFDNADGDGVADLVSGSSTNYPGLGTGDSSGAGEFFTDVNLTSGTQDYSFTFVVPVGTYTSATLRVITFDVESATGWAGTPIQFDGGDSGFRLSAVTGTPSFNPGYVRVDEFILSPAQLALLSDGQLVVTFKDGPALTNDDGMVLDCLELSHTRLDCNANSIPDQCEPDSDGDYVPNDCDLCPATIPGAPIDAQGCPPEIPGDFEHDGDVDAVNLTTFVACSTGPEIPYAAPPPGCGLSLEAGLLPADFDGDFDVDQADFAVFQRCWSGGGIAGDPNCNG